jgi:hypothetical protein
MLVLSMIIYGMAFDFFNISGSLFVERESASRIRASAQGLFMIMTNGLGALLGGVASGWVVGSLYGERHEGLAQHLADVCRICADSRHRFPAGIPVPAQCRDHPERFSEDLSRC